MEKIKRKGVYKQRGDYHKQLDKNWSSYHLHLEKTKIIRNLLCKIPKNMKIIDIGCGEGELVEHFAKQGWNITGLDLNYSSKYVKQANALNTKLKTKFDVVICSDIIEHLDISKHTKLIVELKRLLKKGGLLIFGAPNLAHLASRISFLLTGKFIRTAKPEYHPGDRPLEEYLQLLKNNGFKIIKIQTLPLGVPPFIQGKISVKYTAIIYRFAKLLSTPKFCFDNIITCKLQK